MEIRVRGGDSFWGYSQLFGVPIQLLLDSNPGINPQALMIGQTVNIPGYVTREYQIVPGDTIWQIARTAGVPQDTLLLLNPSIQANSLRVGQIIQIPVRVTNYMVHTSRPYDYGDMLEDLNTLAEVYPFIRIQSIGTSVMGKELPEIRIGIGSKQVHANASFHANEWITTPVLIRFLNEYLLALTNNGSIRGLVMNPLYESTMLSLVPMVDPDGVDLVVNGLPSEEPYRSDVLAINGESSDFSGWKANIRGVDLNNQFPALWERQAEIGPQAPAPRDYPGTAPLTEPESQAMANLTWNSNFSRVLAFHTQGRVIYWGFEGLQPPESEVIVNEFARVSGYEPIEYVESWAGFKDWFIQDWRRPGFTIEVGQGTNPLPLSQFEQIYQESLGILLASL
ncbi:LysM peptidoglycan-binding domain-containing protein [Paenibacillus anaericanus]|uniref:LysM peptidoglycan-binding domain-containing protein n=1 Tax=Paenibacillus anaericanus TaxID=170367 RepID=A0A433Y1M8_9BACL|nr:M14 family metallopeptidase [Paenibacillus anaericanus]RUT41487.1 LysM peptidoglycan-binding domain-containing protein [Paenibacillus anaericanus]